MEFKICSIKIATSTDLLVHVEFDIVQCVKRMSRVLQIFDYFSNCSYIILIVELNPPNIVLNSCIHPGIVRLCATDAGRSDSTQNWSTIFGAD